ncbi:hypothetical protein JW905_05315 [bacterium]|nr:hypothetical protein [candidate division CSSED10-310 bacterium]
MLREVVFEEKGESMATNVVVYITVFLLVFSAWKFGLPVFKHMLFDQYVAKQANWDRENLIAPPPIESIYEMVEVKARNLGIVIPDKTLDINFDGNKLTISADYYLPVNLYVHKFKWPFEVYKETRDKY